MEKDQKTLGAVNSPGPWWTGKPECARFFFTLPWLRGGADAQLPARCWSYRSLLCARSVCSAPLSRLKQYGPGAARRAALGKDWREQPSSGFQAAIFPEAAPVRACTTGSV